MKITAPYRDGYYDLRKLCEKVISAKKKLVKLGISWGRIRYNDNLNCFLIFTFIIRLCINQMHRQAFSLIFFNSEKYSAISRSIVQIFYRFRSNRKKRTEIKVQAKC